MPHYHYAALLFLPRPGHLSEFLLVEDDGLVIISLHLPFQIAAANPYSKFDFKLFSYEIELN